MKLQKSVLKSKTFWFGIATAIAPLIPSVGVFLSENAASVGIVWGAVSIVLRAVTKSKIVLSE